MHLVNRLLLAACTSSTCDAPEVVLELLLLVRVVAAYDIAWEKRDELQQQLLALLERATVQNHFSLVSAICLVFDAWAAKNRLLSAVFATMLHTCQSLSQDVMILGSSAPCDAVQAIGSGVHAIATYLDNHRRVQQSSSLLVSELITSEAYAKLLACMPLIMQLTHNECNHDMDAVAHSPCSSSNSNSNNRFYRPPSEPLFQTLQAVRNCMLAFVRLLRIVPTAHAPAQYGNASHNSKFQTQLQCLMVAVAHALFADIGMPPARIDRLRMWQLRIRWLLEYELVQLYHEWFACNSQAFALDLYRANSLLVSSAPQGEDYSVVACLTDYLLDAQNLLTIAQGELDAFAPTMQTISKTLVRFYSLNLSPPECMSEYFVGFTITL
jgi:hypothetical protein